MTQSEVDAVIRLLDDPDRTVYQIVEDKILSLGSDIIPQLESALFAPFSNNLMQNRIQNLVSKLEFSEISGLITNWISDPSDIYKITWAISRIKDFTLNEIDFREKFIGFSSQFPDYNLNNYSPIERVKIFNFVFYHRFHFSSSLNDNYLKPEFCFVSNVLDKKIGNPISLAIVYMLFARSFGLPIYGVNLPKNFILAYKDAGGVSFYINPFNRGLIFGKNEIDRFLKQQKIKSQPQFYNVCSNETLALRLLAHLEYAYLNESSQSEADNIHKLISIFDTKLDEGVDWI